MLGLASSILCYLFVLFSLTSNAASKDDLVVNTSSGPINGKALTIGSGSVRAYLGIPYAEPPLGKLRFQKPLPHKPWSQIFEATNFGNACLQSVLSQTPEEKLWNPNRPLSEDCLFLNIWVPHPQPSVPIPILVWIHGGGFVAGTSSLDLYNGASLAATENVIVASMNYRLGALGFLSLPPAVPGNMGLWDQHLALTWIKQNAAAFGGDPKRVTIFGHSAGAASVGFHLLSPKSEPLFAQAVLQSGAIYASASPGKAKNNSLEFSQLLGCGEGNENEIVSCLQDKNAVEFPQHEASLSKKKPLYPVFEPTADGEFLTDDPQSLLDSQHVQIKPVLTGVASDEAAPIVDLIILGSNYSQINMEIFLTVLRYLVRNATEDDIQAMALKYSEESHGPAKYRSALVQSLGDYFFVCPVAKFAGQIRNVGSPVYVYLFTHHTSGTVWPEWVGVPHGAELIYLFGNFEAAFQANKTHTEAEEALSRRIMRYWAEFARTGKPTGSGKKEVEWPRYNATLENFYHLSTEPAQVLPVSPARHCNLFKTHTINPKKSDED
uniref:Carboxylic ester hydrolase n=1 Tax=Anolis carolinensis TaxID=28377 RepID=R4G9W1_ANOCA|nr:PREDICTED: acetylcholinesterase [Anolis carolinensis]|eukprot:XP_003218004.1 PREDICTED: acetylcholinesterase [Anolis carolinensis]